MDGSPLLAYLDPGTGSYIFQLLLAAVLGGLFAFKLGWRHARLFLAGLFARGRRV